MIFLGYTIFDEKGIVKNFDLLLRELSVEDQSEILKYKFWRDRQATLFGKLLLKKILRENFKLSEVPKITTEEHGRPLLQSDLDFNISHSGKYVHCVVSDKARIGVDVEKHRQVNIENFGKYFTTKEWKEIYAYDNPLKGFFDFWSLKESVIKADGRGVAILQKTEKKNNQVVVCDSKYWHFKQLDLAHEYSSFIASSEPINELEIQKIKTSELGL